MQERHKAFPTARNALAQTWGQTPTSSSFLQTVSALKAFGLVEDEGAGEDRKFKLTDLALRILRETREELRSAAVKEAATKPPLLKEFQDRWESGRPSDEHCVSELELDHGFTHNTAVNFLKVFDETFRFLEGGPSDKNPESVDNGDSNDPPDTERQVRKQRVQRQEVSGMKEDVFTLAEGDAVLQWPTSISPESYADLKDWLGLMLRKIERQVQADDETAN